MTKTGPQIYPGAIRGSHWYEDNWGGDAMESNVIVLHTTEGLTVPGYNGGSQAPNMTVLPKILSEKAEWYQHFSVDVSSRALANKLGGVATNTLNVYQLEMVGTCDDSKRNTWKIGSKTYRAGVDYIYWPEAPDWLLKEVAKHIAWLVKNHNFKLNVPKLWLRYGKDDRRPGVTPASYGASPARMTFSQWENFYGICGHMHAPENTHGDPGAFPIERLLKFVREILNPTTSYTVKDGDTLYSIAKKFLGDGNRYTEIKTLNKLTSDTISPGQKLKIPAK
ncbi:hypothetical protein GCM10010423_65030 [Streptomyces levis]|uniref:LysM domain-containing protein n=1 Tax=Streptomyces levis TaxID=285566 RepID=A0ABP6BBP1_9ACTN